MYARSELPGLLGQEPAYSKGINGTFELAVDFPFYEDVDREFAKAVQLLMSLTRMET